MGKLRDSLVRLKKSIVGEPDADREEALKTLAESSDEESLGEDEVEDDEEEDDEEEEDEGEEEEDEEDIALSDAEIDDDADVIPHQKVTVNNKAALEKSLKSIQLKNLPFVEHFQIAGKPIVLKDIYDDIERELAFYKQGLEAATDARKILKKENVPFSRPVDYFAEMVKSDEHMDRLKKKLVDEKTQEKAGQEAKRQRQLKKFGKKVQHERLQDRQKEKRQMMDRLNSLKKKGKDHLTSEDFDIAVEEATANRPAEKSSKRKAKDSKYGHGGKKRFRNSNDAESSGDLSGFNAKRMKTSGSKVSKGPKGPKKRPGKSKRR